jgi:predicted nucleic acid-binding protein
LILADTSIWIEHFRVGSAEMAFQLGARNIVIHPFVVAELALGGVGNRAATLTLLDLLPRSPVAQLAEVRQMIEARSLFSRGIGLTDAHLIASALLNRDLQLWTRDRRLQQVAGELKISADLP